MKTITLFLVLFLCVLFQAPAFGQFDLLEKVKDKVEQKANEKTDEAIDKAVEDATKKPDNENKQAVEGKEANDNNNGENVSDKASDKGSNEVKELKSYTKYDFVPGEKVLFYEDFAQDNVGDFPAKWNTNSGGEVVTLDKYPGKWLQAKLGGVVYPEISTAFPENFTLEFDLIFTQKDGIPEFTVKISSTRPGEPMDAIVPGNGGIGFRFSHINMTAWNWIDANYGEISINTNNDYLTQKDGVPVRISVSVQKQRFRMYVDDKKIFDIPRMMPKNMVFDRITIDPGSADSDEGYHSYFSNVRVAVGAPDIRSKLITEGKLVTRGILFDSGSDKIKAESYGTLKEIATVLKENAGVKVQIVGHTDSDGAEETNMELSKKRAAAVKISLNKDFGIDASRMETDGKGESVPVSDNGTAEGKANNRRVEFIKL